MKKQKVICDCDTEMIEGKAKVEGLYLRAMVCPKCNYKTLTLEQLKEGRAILELHKQLDIKKKISKVGNSLALLLPEGVKRLGMTIGAKVRIEAIDNKSFKVIRS